MTETTQPEAEPVLRVEDLRYSYKRTQALKGITFSVSPRSIYGLLGPNGAGKTTTLRILATLLKPQGGRAEVFGQDIRRRYKAVRRRIGYMPDHLSLYRQMTVFECLDFFAAAYGMAVAKRNAVIDDVLDLTDMRAHRDHLIKGLSRGMTQRVSLARTLVHDPDLLLLDEPASGLDPRARIELMEILRELSRMGKTIFISSHILAELAELCDSVTIIDRGAVKYSGSMGGLLAQRGEVGGYVVTLRAEHPPAAEAIRQIEGVVQVTQGAGPASYRVALDADRTDANAVLQAVLKSGGQVASFREDTRQLSEAFMELTEPGVPS